MSQYALPWNQQDLGPFDPSKTDKAKIEAGHPVPCRLCEAVYRVLTVTMRYCATCEQGYCQSQHGGWVGRRGSCIQCGPHEADPPLPTQPKALAGPMVEFEEFLRRLKQEFAKAPQRQPGHHILVVENWTRDGRGLPGTISVLWQGGDTFYWETGTGKVANFSRAEIHAVYQAWRDYLGGRLGRSSIRKTVFNSKPIISLFKKFEDLMY